MKTLTIELPYRRQAVLQVPAEYTSEDLAWIAKYVELWQRIREKSHPEQEPAFDHRNLPDES